MVKVISTAVRFLIRTAVLWLVDALSLAAASWIMPGLMFQAVDDTPRWVVIVSAAMLLAIVNLLIRPVILLVARPLGWIAMLFVGFLVNAVAIWITAWLLPGFDATLLAGLFGAILISFFNTILTGILEVDEEGSFYQNRIERLARRHPFDGANEPGRGLMMLEIDGLSYWHLQKAIDDGLMPTLTEMMEEDGYVLSHIDCGLPSMTSACQAGILFGDNFDIPAYRWYDKSKQKLYVSAADATELNARYARGQGLMRNGSSVMNMFDGDAEKSMFTMANMMEAGADEKKRRADDITLLMLDPYFLTNALALFIWEIGRELWEAWRQKRNNVQPRLNRLKHWYPFVRAAMCTLMRDISTNIAIMDMMRGAPSIYMLYLGYDEVAHHSGPWTDDAFGDLKRLDRTLARLRNVAKERAPRAYDLILLSDHGQSFGPTFAQRYGLSIKEYIEQVMPQGISVSQSFGGDTGAMGLTGLAGELSNVSTSDSGNAFDRSLAKQGHKLANKGVAEGVVVVEGAPASVTAYGSGNAAQVYFDLYPRKIKLSELEAAYPGTVQAIVQHDGIGLVLGYEDDDTVLVMGKTGARNLHTSEVTGEDPLIPYAPASGHGAATIEKRIWQLKRVMDFPSAGDLWLISTVYPDGTVAALEELIGNHGGVGGEQTDAFLFHPPDMEVPDTRNSIDVHFILDKHRNAPVVERPAPIEEEVADWSLGNMGSGLRQVGKWAGTAVRCLFLERSAYEQVVKDPYMTGPALLLALAAALAGSWLRAGRFDFLHFLATFGLWLVSVFVLYLAGMWLTKKGQFAKTLRGVGFGQAVYLLAPLALIPTVGTMFRPLLVVLGFLTTWLGAAAAHESRGWRTVLLPVVAYAILTIGYVLIGVLLTGLDFAIQGVLDSLGLQAP
jgi:uncharacterized membrane protein YvlD (DUF360 family)